MAHVSSGVAIHHCHVGDEDFPHSAPQRMPIGPGPQVRIALAISFYSLPLSLANTDGPCSVFGTVALFSVSRKEQTPGGGGGSGAQDLRTVSQHGLEVGGWGKGYK